VFGPGNWGTRDVLGFLATHAEHHPQRPAPAVETAFMHTQRHTLKATDLDRRLVSARTRGHFPYQRDTVPQTERHDRAGLDSAAPRGHYRWLRVPDTLRTGSQLRTRPARNRTPFRTRVRCETQRHPTGRRLFCYPAASATTPAVVAISRPGWLRRASGVKNPDARVAGPRPPPASHALQIGRVLPPKNGRAAGTYYRPLAPTGGPTLRRDRWSAHLHPVQDVIDVLPPSQGRRDNRCMIDVEGERFEDMVIRAPDSVPPELGRVMANVAVTVHHDAGPMGLLGLYQGIPLTHRTTRYAGVLPDRNTIYRRAICAICRGDAEVVEQVRRTLVHEIGHHFGIDDTRLHELGW